MKFGVSQSMAMISFTEIEKWILVKSLVFK